MNTTTATCPQCGESAGSGRIFCLKCGATVQAPVPLLPRVSVETDAGAKVGVLRKAIILIIKATAIVAGLTFWFSRLSTNIGLILFGASIIIGGLCAVALSYLDDDFLKNQKNEGYWPSRPIDWGTKAQNPPAVENPNDGNPPVGARDRRFNDWR
jgi:hypothetical protein